MCWGKHGSSSSSSSSSSYLSTSTGRSEGKARREEEIRRAFNVDMSKDGTSASSIFSRQRKLAVELGLAKREQEKANQHERKRKEASEKSVAQQSATLDQIRDGVQA